MSSNNAINYIQTNFDSADRQKKQIMLNYIYSIKPELVIIRDNASYADIAQLNNEQLLHLIEIIVPKVAK
jgi:hypothetical protein